MTRDLVTGIVETFKTAVDLRACTVSRRRNAGPGQFGPPAAIQPVER